jgi:hypothetical protein
MAAWAGSSLLAACGIAPRYKADFCIQIGVFST